MIKSMQTHQHRMKKADHHLSFIVFSILAGSIATLWGYSFGTGNQIEQLPIVMRALDADFLTNDFFTNTSANFGPRLYFAYFIAFFCHWFDLSHLYLVLTTISNITIGLVSAYFARDLFDGSRSAGLLSAAAVLGLKSFWLGASNTVYQTYLDPSHLIMPLLLVAIWAGIRRKIIISVLFSGLASLIHPLMGMETGAILLGINLLFWLGEWKNSRKSLQNLPLKQMAAALILYLVFSIPSLLPYLSAEQISAEQFIEIVAYLRHPHHYLPSTFGLLQYIQAFTFLIAAAIAYFQASKNSRIFGSCASFIKALTVFLFLLCFGGYLFVEVLPSRLWVTAQVFRLLYIIKWLGLVTIAGNWMKQREESQSEDRLYLFTSLISLMAPPSMMIYSVFDLFKDKSKRFRATFSTPVFNVLFLLGIFLTLLLYRVEARVYILFPLFLLMAAGLIKLPSIAGISTCLLCTAIVLTSLLAQGSHLPAQVNSLMDKPIITLTDLQDDSSEVAEFARAKTAENALFIVPPKMGEFRYTAGRAIVVDFKAFPFQDEAMLEWQHRLYACYGAPATTGWQAETDMTLEFRHIDDTHLRQLQDLYNIDYAVLYSDTQTSLPAIFEGQMYKIIRLKE